MIEIILIAIVLAAISGYLPFALIAVALLFLAIWQPATVKLIVVGTVGLLMAKQNDPWWQQKIAALGKEHDKYK